MKKVFQVIAILVLVGMVSVPTYAGLVYNSNVVTIDDEPVKKDEQKSDVQTTENKETEQKSECPKAAEKKSSCTKASRENHQCTKDKPACCKK